MRSLRIPVVAILAITLVCVLGLPAAHAVTTNFVAGAGYAAGSAAEVSSAEAFTGSGSWQKSYPGAPVEMYIDPVSQFGTTFTVDEIADIRYWTKNDGTNPSNVDFYMKIYTVPDLVDDDAGWYGRRLNAEPLYSNSYAPQANAWVEWSAASPPQNQLVWFDSNNVNNLGFYGSPTLADLQAGAIDWSTWPGGGGGNATPIDYGSETVLYFTIGTGSGWPSFDGYLDAITIELTNGDSYVFDLEGPADPVYVDDDWAGAAAATEVAPGLFMGHNAYDTINGAVAVAQTHVNVAAGSYQEQVVIDHDLELVGAGIGVSTILSPATLTTTYATSKNYKPVVTVIGAPNALVSGFTVDGAGAGNANVTFVGVGWFNSGGELSECHVTGIRNSPLDGAQHGLGIYGISDDGGSYTIECRDNVVDDFQKNGISWNAVNSTTTDVVLTGNQVTGSPGMSAANGDPAQNGIQVLGDLTTVLLDGNTVDGVGYDNSTNPTKYVATSVLLYYADATVSNNQITNAQAAGYMIEGSANFQDNTIGVLKYGDSGYGLIASDPPAAVPSPFDFTEGGGTASRKAGLLTNTIDGNVISFSGVDYLGTVGIESDAGYYDFLADGPETQILTITNNTVTGFEVAVALFECTSGCSGSDFGSIDVHYNDFTGNDYGLYTNAFSAPVEASCNWWGDISGPTAVDNINGTGAAIDGAATAQPWLDGPGGACTLSPDYVSAGPAPSEINGCTNCILIPIDLSRSDVSAARGVSVTFELSPELELCGTPTISLGPGTFYDGYAGQVQEFFLDNGNGTYTFDSSILGSPCGPEVGGEVFAVPVTHAPGIVVDTTGTLSINSVILRDCANAPLPATPGPGATIEIDVTAPGVITNLAAVQKTTGNDTDGTTIIDLAWDLPVDLDLTAVEVYRKGFGFYPEYDDDGGSAPTAPTDPTDALANGWVLAASLPANATSLADEPAVRDFWYYVAFALDECYASAVSNQTDGTLNYHLGDVALAPTGDNSVSTLDISALGAAYGTADGDVSYNAAADVGPTTNYSVAALPTTDNLIQFEDLIMFAINHSQVSRSEPVAAVATNRVEVSVPAGYAVGDMISIPVRMGGDGTLQGVSISVDWNQSVLEYTGYSAGSLMSSQGAPLFSPKPGVLDAAVLGRESQGISGEGLVANLHFRVRGDGDPGVRVAEVDARNANNERVTLDGAVVGGTPPPSGVVSRSALRPNAPNPFNPRTTVYFDLAQSGRVQVRVYAVNGRLVRKLVSGSMEAGPHEVLWDGVDDSGRSVASGTYHVQLVAPDHTDSRSIVLLK